MNDAGSGLATVLAGLVVFDLSCSCKTLLQCDRHTRPLLAWMNGSEGDLEATLETGREMSSRWDDGGGGESVEKGGREKVLSGEMGNGGDGSRNDFWNGGRSSCRRRRS